MYMPTPNLFDSKVARNRHCVAGEYSCCCHLSGGSVGSFPCHELWLYFWGAWGDSGPHSIDKPEQDATPGAGLGKIYSD